MMCDRRPDQDGMCQFDIDCATHLASFCEASYHPGLSIDDLNAGQAATADTDLIEQRILPSGAAYFVARTPSAVYVIFRGTANVENVVSDLNVALVELPWLASEAHARVPKGHAGFVDLYLSMRQHVLDATRRARAATPRPAASVYVSGHSLGGALATLFAADVAAAAPELLPHLRVYSFGSPRVGDEAFARAWRVPCAFRCRNQHDLIPRLPLWSLAFKYTHVGREVVFVPRTGSADGGALAWQLEPPRLRELSPKQLVDKFIAYPHLEQLDVQHHIHYLDSTFPKNPFGPVALQAAHDALKAEVEALRTENERLRAENERLAAENRAQQCASQEQS